MPGLGTTGKLVLIVGAKIMMAYALKFVMGFLVFTGSLRMAEYLLGVDFYTPISLLPYIFEAITGTTIEIILDALSVPPDVGIYYKYGSLFWAKMAIAEKSSGITFLQMTKRKHGEEAGIGIYIIMFMLSPIMFFFFCLVSVLYLLSRFSREFRYQIAQSYADPEEYKMLVIVSRVFNIEMLSVLIAFVFDRAAWEAWRWMTAAA